jgi:hypothetical protein
MGFSDPAGSRWIRFVSKKTDHDFIKSSKDDPLGIGLRAMAASDGAPWKTHGAAPINVISPLSDVRQA